MIPFEHALILLLLTTGFGIVARWVPWPSPIVCLAGGAAVALIPGFPRIALDPGFFFVCFLPPLLFSDGWLMPLREFAKVKRPVFMLSVGLVIFTILAVGFVARALFPGLPLPLAFALGAVVSPTDAVAVNAITGRLKLPARMTAVLNGESLMNDATGLVAFKFALAAFAAGTFSLRAAALDFVVVAAGGLGVGLAAGWVVGRLRDLLRRTGAGTVEVEVTLSLLTPYAAYLATEPFGFSSVLAVVAAGLYSGGRDPIRMDAETRQMAWSVWSMLLYWLNGLAFVLLGLQLPKLLAEVSDDCPIPRAILCSLAVAGTVMGARMLWIFPGAWLPFLLSEKVRRTEARPSWQTVLVGGWAGMRGTVTLAAALSIPFVLDSGAPFPFRDIIVFLAFGVIATTLLVQGTTFGWLIRRLGLHQDDSVGKEEQLARVTAVGAGVEALRALKASAEGADQSEALGQVIAEYELRLSALGARGRPGAHARKRRAAEQRFRVEALKAERRAIDELWRTNVIVDDVHRPLQQLLDHEEGMLKS